ncbi:DUF4380 domain-containing protein [bacterium]|nr:DUF4380 domain-containing protein [bacterium]
MEYKDKFNYGGWGNCIKLSNGKIELVATADVGPRIIRFGEVNGKNLFKEFKNQLGLTGGDEWRSYGGIRFWYAPEVFPRTYYPDNSPVKYSWDGKILKLSQETEKTTGIKKEMEVTMDEKNNYVRIVYRLINNNVWDIELAPWAISVMAENSLAIVPQEPFQYGRESLLPVRPLSLWGYTKMQDPRWTWGDKYITLKQNPKSNSSQKIGVLNSAGWVAGYNEGEILIKRYDYNSDFYYPDFDCNTEIYTDQDVLELETLGPLAILEPKTEIEYREYLFYFKAFIENTDKSIDDNLIPLVKETDKLIKF